MPAELERLRKAIWEEIKGKINPKTKKPFNESDAWAIATAQYKRKNMSISFEEDESPMELLIKAIKKEEDKYVSS